MLTRDPTLKFTAFSLAGITRFRKRDMFKKSSLSSRLLLLISAWVFLNLAGSLGTVWHTYRIQSIYAKMLDQDIKALTAAQELETELVMQKGLTTYFFLTNDVKWLDQLSQHHNRFKHWLNVALDLNPTGQDQTVLGGIGARYRQYVADRDHVIALFKEGKRQESIKAHWRVRDQFFRIYDLTGNFKRIHENQITDLRIKVHRSANRMVLFAWAAIPCVLIVSGLLALILFKQILKPIHDLAMGTGGKPDEPMDNEVKIIQQRMEGLIENIDQTQAKLIQSQAHLIQSEKLAVVGKLAAGVAHSVRNPLTSVKMRLFTLERGLQMTPTQKEDLEVISEEIRNIDTILRHFLEYARPPKLKMQLASASDVVDMTLQLLKYRFDAYQTRVVIERTQRLPEIRIDTDQVKEALVNLMVNACEAMGEGGMIRIIEQTGVRQAIGESVLIAISDDGPGIPAGLHEQIFEPFFSSKEEGSGLGLSIAKRIVEEHGGQIHVQSKEGVGVTFLIALPLKEAIDG
jgi:signal transduction histidine kinase